MSGLIRIRSTLGVICSRTGVEHQPVRARGNPAIFVYQYDSIRFPLVSNISYSFYSKLFVALKHGNSGDLAFRTVAWCGVCEAWKVLTKHTLGFRFFEKIIS